MVPQISVKKHFSIQLPILPQPIGFNLLNFAAVPHEVVRHQEATDGEEDIHQQWGVADHLVAYLLGVVEHEGRVLNGEKRVPLHVEAQDQEAANGPRAAAAGKGVLIPQGKLLRKCGIEGERKKYYVTFKIRCLFLFCSFSQ